MRLSEAIEILENNGLIVEEKEPGYLRGDLSPTDRRRIAQGKAPFWARKVTEIPPRQRERRYSTSYAEEAMRGVTTPDGKARRPYSETGMRRDNDAAIAANRNIGTALEQLLDDFSSMNANKDYLSVFMPSADGQLDEFRVISTGTGYNVKFVGHRSVFDRDFKKCKSLADVAKYIQFRE